MKISRFAIVAALALSLGSLFAANASAQPAAKPSFNLCTGSESGNYFKAGNLVKKRGNDNVNINVISTKGSNDNLDKIMDKTCDGAFVQPDAVAVYASQNARLIPMIERGGVLYKEYLHFVCNRDAKFGKITDLTAKHTVAIGPDGAGNRITWAGFVLADKVRYNPVQTDNRAGLRALGAVEEGTEVHCMVYVAALKAPFMSNDVNAKGSRVVLVPADDKDLLNLKDNKGRPIYTKESIPGGTYRNIQDGAFSSAVNTVGMDAIFVASTDYINNRESDYDKVMRAFNGSKSEIQALVTPR